MISYFKVFDKDQSGFLDCSELRRIMVNLGDKLTDDEVDLVIVQSDLDGDGSCNYEGITFSFTLKYIQTNSYAEKQACTKKLDNFQIVPRFVYVVNFDLKQLTKFTIAGGVRGNILKNCLLRTRCFNAAFFKALNAV